MYIICICFSFSDTVRQSLGPSTSLNDPTPFLLMVNLPLYMYISCLLYPFLCCGHSGCFHALAIVNSAAVNIEAHVFVWILAFSGYMPSIRIAESYGNAFSFLGTFRLFSVVAVSIYFPTSNTRRFPFCHTLSSIYCL